MPNKTIDPAVPLSLYVHIPWCVKKCPYCDFNSHEPPAPTIKKGEALPVSQTSSEVAFAAASVGVSSELEQQYYQRLVLDLDAELSHYRSINQLDGAVSLQSIFFGGGTPSLLSPSFYAGLLAWIANAFDCAENIEITLEANPGTAEADRFSGYRDAGINRLSLGVQSFDDQHLSTLGRIHSSGEAIAAFNMARQAGFSNINIDLMYGLPNQSIAGALSDIQSALTLSPEHLSWYQLTIEKNTAFYSDPPLLPKEDPIEDMFGAGTAALQEAGFKRYEISAYARVGRESMHNNNYWTFGDYLGIGAGAHSKVTGGAAIARRWKTRAPKDYLQGDQVLAGEKAIEDAELPMEFMMNALRLKRGFTQALFEQRTGLPYQLVAERVSALVQKGLLVHDEQTIATSEVGMHYLDSILTEF